MANPNTSREEFIKFLNTLTPDQKIQFIEDLNLGKNGHELRNATHLTNSLNKEQLAAYEAFWNIHTGIFLGGGNSKNFEIQNTITQEVFVLKMEDRFGTVPISLVGTTAAPFLSPRHFSENIKIGPNPDATRAIIITEKSNFGDLSALCQTVPHDHTLENALELYPQMIDFFLALQENEIFMSDAKNSNFLVHLDLEVSPPSIKLRVSDDKSFLATQKGIHHIDFNSTFFNTNGYLPPEAGLEGTIVADSYHAYILGKNIYQFMNKMHEPGLKDLPSDPNALDFSNPIFHNAQGRELRALIKKLVDPNPKNRISLAQAKKVLQMVASPAAMAEKEFQDKKKACQDLYIDIIKQKLQPNDPLMNEFCKTMSKRILDANFDTIDSLHADLKQIKDSVCSKDAKELIETIQKFKRQSKQIFSFGNAKKADAISAALAKIPLLERDRAYQNPDVIKALSTHRHPGKKGEDITKNPAAAYRKIMENQKSPLGTSNDNAVDPLRTKPPRR